MKSNNQTPQYNAVFYFRKLNVQSEKMYKVNVYKDMLIALLLLFNLPFLKSLSFSIFVSPSKAECFYESLSSQQKYVVEVSPSMGQYRDEVYKVIADQVIDDAWHVAWHRSHRSQTPHIIIHKRAAASSLYRFCFISQERIKIDVIISSGMQLLDTQVLLSDEHLLENEINVIQRLSQIIYQASMRIQTLKYVSKEMTSMVSLKTIFYAILILIVIFTVNICFYKIIKKQLKIRKLI